MTGYEGLITQLLKDPAHNAMKAAAVIRLLVKDTFRLTEAAHDISNEGEWVLWKDIAQKEHLENKKLRETLREQRDIVLEEAAKIADQTDDGWFDERSFTAQKIASAIRKLKGKPEMTDAASHGEGYV